MKKTIAAFAMVLIMAAPAWATGVVGNTADSLVAAGRGYFRGMVVHTDGTNAVTVAIYDSLSATGTKLVSTWTVTTSATDRVQAISFDDGECPFSTGIYVDVTTSGTVTYDTYYTAQ